MSLPSTSSGLRIMAWLQALYFLPSGCWALLHIESFQWVTGPKTDLWLVRTVAGLLIVTGLVLLRAAWKKQVPVELAWLAAGQATVLATAAAIYPLRGTISAIYLFDAIGHGLLALGWVVALLRRHKHRSPHSPARVRRGKDKPAEILDLNSPEKAQR